MTDRSRICRYAAGLGALLLGGIIVTGFVTRTEVMVRLPLAIHVAVALNTAIGFCLAGLILLAPLWARRRADAVGQALGAILALLALGVLAERVFNRGFGLDAVRWHLWLGVNDSAPGRMAPNTCLGLLAFGLAFVLLPAVRARLQAVVYGLTLAVLAIGAAGLLGYVFHFDTFFAWTSAMSMAPQTTLGLLLIGFGLACSWKSSPWAESEEHPIPRILFSATVALLLVAAVAGISVLYLPDQVEQNNAVHELTQRRDDRALYVANVIERMAATERAAAARPLPRDAAGLAQQAASLVAQCCSGVAFFDAQGGLLAAAGTFQDQAPIAVPLHLAGAPQLLWRQGYYLHLDAPLQLNVPPPPPTLAVAQIRLEAPVPLLDRLDTGANSWGETGETSLCGRISAPQSLIACFPQRLRPWPVFAPSTGSPQTRAGELPLLNPGAGSIHTRDFRGKRVLAAYGPLGATGLGLVTKMDLAELYSPVRRIFKLIVPVLALLIVVGVLAMHRQLRPLLAEIVASRNRAMESETRFRAAVASSMDGFYILDGMRGHDGEISDFRLEYVNGNGERMLALARGQTLGRNMAGFARALGQGDFIPKFKRVMDSAQPLDEEFALNLRGSELWLHHQVVPLGGGVAVTVRDITERKNNEARLMFLASSAPLAGVANRISFIDRLDRELAARRAGIALLYLDIDHFKLANDTLGHVAGDAILSEVARRLTACVRSTDLVARLGGDEFTVLLAGLENVEAAERVVTAILTRLALPIEAAGELRHITASIGVAFCRGSAGITSDLLLHEADAALYNVKRGGRNGFRLVATGPTEN